MTQKACVARHPSGFHFSDVFLTDLGLDILCMTFVLMQYLCYTNGSTLSELNVYVARLTELRAQNVKTAFLTFDLILT